MTRIAEKRGRGRPAGKASKKRPAEDDAGAGDDAAAGDGDAARTPLMEISSAGTLRPLGNPETLKTHIIESLGCDAFSEARLPGISTSAKIRTCRLQGHFGQIPGYPDTSKFLKLRIANIARIPGYTYPDISPDTTRQLAEGIGRSKDCMRGAA